MEPEAHEFKKIQPMPNEICHNGDTRPNIPKTPNSKKPDPRDEIPNALMPKKPNDALRMQEPQSMPFGVTNDREYIISPSRQHHVRLVGGKRPIQLDTCLLAWIRVQETTRVSYQIASLHNIHKNIPKSLETIQVGYQIASPYKIFIWIFSGVQRIAQDGYELPPLQNSHKIIFESIEGSLGWL